MGWPTTAEVISAAARELGLVAAAIADPYSSRNAAVLQLCALLDALGQDLVLERQWTHLQKEATISTVNGTQSYALPSDFGRPLDDTQYNRTTQFFVPAGASAQQWQLLKAVQASGVLYQLIRSWDGRVHIHPTPTAAETLVYEYVSRHWVEALAHATLDCSTLADGDLDTVFQAVELGAAGNDITVQLTGDSGGGAGVTVDVTAEAIHIHYEAGVSTVADVEAAVEADNDASALIEVETAGTAATVLDFADAFAATNLSGGTGTSGTADAEVATSADDVCHFDRRLLVAGLKLYFRRAKGFDTTAAEAEYERTLGRVAGGDGTAPVLTLGRHGEERRVDAGNATVYNEASRRAFVELDVTTSNPIEDTFSPYLNVDVPSTLSTPPVSVTVSAKRNNTNPSALFSEAVQVDWEWNSGTGQVDIRYITGLDVSTDYSFTLEIVGA